MRGANLMQAIARVNRVFQEKPGGLVVDYLVLLMILKMLLKPIPKLEGNQNQQLMSMRY